MMRRLIITAMCVCLAITAAAADNTIPDSKGVPDLTRGGKLTRINSRWVGPVGINCGAWRPVQGRDNAHQAQYVRQLLVMSVDEGSPADGILQKDDVIIGADGTGATKVPLLKGADWAMIPIADVITAAEARKPALLKLLVWRPVKQKPSSPTIDPKKKAAKDKEAPGGYTEGKTMAVTIKLEALGRYSETAPYSCEKSRNVLRKGIKALYEENKPDKAGLGILCLLAANDPTNPDNDKYQARAKEWAHGLEPGGSPWFSGPRLMALAEYYMKTKDETIFPKLVKQAEHHARGVSWFGTSGHRWSEKKPDGSHGGRLGGYGPINCSGALGFLGLSLARKAGVKSAAVEAAHRSQRCFFGHFALRSGIGYGEMPYGIAGGRGDTNGKLAMPGLALGLEKDQVEKAKYFAQMTALASDDVRKYAHGGSFFGQIWHPVGAAQGGVKAANLQFREIRWHLDLKRRWNHTRIYDASGNNYGDFSHAATALLLYALPLKQLYITGRDQNEALKLSEAEFKELLAIKNFDASKATTQELIAELSRHQGMTRGVAARELANRIKEKPESAESAALVDRLLALAADSKAATSGRAGACTAMMYLKDRARDAVASLKNAEIAKTMVGLLQDPDPYIQFGGVRAMQKLDPAVIRPHANEIMDAIVAKDRATFPLVAEDPVRWAHGEMGSLLFGSVLKDGLDGVDRKKLIPALRSALATPNGGARNRASRILSKLTIEDVRELGAVLVDNVMFPAPANAMGGSGGPNAQAALAKHLFEEALPLSLIYGGGAAIKNKIPQKYGKAAFTMQSSRKLMRSLGDMMLIGASIDANKVIEEMKKAPAPEKLHKLKRINSIKAAQSALKLPAARTELVVDARNYGCDENATTYIWRKVYGAGKVSFTPNASGKSKKTTVVFLDEKPGKYRFEVTMSDKLGLNELTRTVDVTLHDKRGKLPRNRPPQAASRTGRAVPGRPGRIRLSGTDPDGDDLGFAVTKPPAHGRLTGVGGNLIYTANYGFNGTDRLTFNAIDGQGETASGAITIEVSDKNVGLVVYEGFDYSAGAIQDRGGAPSFGFKGPWTNTRGTKDFYVVDDESSSYTDLPSTGGKLVKGQRWWPASRSLDTKALSDHKLLDNGRELWFSMFVEQPEGMLFNFTGPDISFGMAFEARRSEIHATFQGQKAGKANNPYSRSSGLRFPKGPHMIIGRCIWGKTDDEPDTMEIFRIFDAPEFGPLLLEKPVCVLSEVIPQQKINQVWMKGFEKGTIDELRIGPTRHSVMVGTKPLARRQ